MKKNISTRNTSIVVRALVLTCLLSLTVVVAVSAAENWKAQFDDICGKVQGADSLSNQELSAMVEKADKLAPEIQRSDDPAKKVYLQRLKKCRNLYAFMLETRQTGGK